MTETKKCIYGDGQPALPGDDVCEFCKLQESIEAEDQWREDHGY